MFKLLSTLLLQFVAMILLLLLYFFLFFRFISRCNFYHSSLWPSLLQWLQWFLGSFHLCTMASIFLSFPHFLFLLPSLKASCFSFYFDPFDYALFKPMFSRYSTSTQASSTNLGFKKITWSCRWLCQPTKYLRNTYKLFGDIPSIISIFLNSMVYACTLRPKFCLK